MKRRTLKGASLCLCAKCDKDIECKRTNRLPILPVHLWGHAKNFGKLASKIVAVIKSAFIRNFRNTEVCFLQQPT